MARNTRVLIVEDDVGIAEAVVEVLEMEGHEARWAYGGDAVQAACGFSPHVILLDIMMAPLTGYEVAEQLHANEDARDIPIVVMTAMRNPTQAALQVQAVDILPKPFDVGELLSVIERSRHAA